MSVKKEKDIKNKNQNSPNSAIHLNRTTQKHFKTRKNKIYMHLLQANPLNIYIVI